MFVERLEARELLASDLLGLGSGAESGSDAAAALIAPVSTAAPLVPPVAGGEGEAQAAQQDLVAFAKALTQAGVKYYGTAWCKFCTSQKQLFQDGADFLPFIEVTNPDRSRNQVGISNGIESYPTWVFPDGSRLVGEQTLATISQRSNVQIPTSNRPSLAPIADTTLLSGSPLLIPLNGYDPNGDPLTYSVTSSNPQVTYTIPQGNRSLKINVKDSQSNYGEMVLQLFEDMAPRPASRVIELAQSGFYDTDTDTGGTKKMTFHRIISGFMIQGGDPTGTGSGGSTLGKFDDQFNTDLQHNRDGILSFAKSTDDTNDSQFFVTLGPARHLDYNHSIFGFLVEGYHQLNAIGNVPTGANDKPTPYDVTMDSVTVFTDPENGALMLKAPEGYTGSADITVTVSDGQGNSSQQTFHINVLADTGQNSNGFPFLRDIPAVTTTRNTPATFQLTAADVEGNAVAYEASKSGSVNSTVSVTTSGLVTATPPADYVGSMQVSVRVKAPDATATNYPNRDLYDSQLVTVNVLPPAPTLALLAASDSNIQGDKITNIANMTFRVSNVLSGATVKVLNGTVVVGQATATGTTADVNVNMASLGGGVYRLKAVQTVNSMESAASAEEVVTLDTNPPPAFTSTPPTTGNAGSPVVYNAQNPEEGTTGLTYALVNPPDNASINAATGVLNWVPTVAQAGVQSFQIKATDAAGNVRTQELAVTITAAEQKARLRLAVTDAQGAPLTQVNVGQEFQLRAYTFDFRTGANQLGVWAAYMDVNYDKDLVTPVSTALGDVTFGPVYTNTKSGTLVTLGLIDEIGAYGAFDAPGPNEQMLFAVRMKATKAGEALFTGDPADTSGYELLLYPAIGDAVAELPWNTVTFQSTTLTINAPVKAVADTFNVDEDSSQTTLEVLTNDTNATSGTTLTISQTGATNRGGTVTIATDSKSLKYTPAADYNGEETFTYTVSNGQATDTATVTMQVAPKNDAPNAVDDSVKVSRDSTANNLFVLTNDTMGADTGETLRVSAVGTPNAGGTVTIAPNGTHVIYAPKAGFTGQETLTYTLTDRAGSDGLTDQATVTVTVEATKSPTVVGDTATVTEDSSANTINVLANDAPSTAGAALSVTGVTQPTTGGTVTIAADKGSVKYTPAPNFAGTDTFTYTVSEANAGSTTGTVTVTVTNVNDAPTAVDDDLSVLKDGGKQTLDVLANDIITPDANETLTISAVTQPGSGGTVAIAADKKSLEFTPTAGFEGTATFTYTATDRADGTGLSDSATVTVPVRAYTVRDIGGTAAVSDFQVGGVEIKLTGTDAFNKPVSLTVVTQADGSYNFGDLAPGTYKVTPTAPAFLLTTTTEITVTSQTTDSDSLANNITLPGRQPQFVGLVDFMARAPRMSAASPTDAIQAATEAGKSQLWYSFEAGWTDYKQATVTLSQDAKTITVRVTDKDGKQFTGELQAGDARVQFIGRDGDKYLLRIVGNLAKLGLTQDTTTSVAITTPIAGDGIVNNAEKAAVTISGTAEAGATVKLSLRNGTTTLTPTVTLTGTAWTATADLTSLADGSVTVTANSTDAGGNTATDTKTITKDTTTSVAITTPIAGDGSVNNTEKAAVAISGTAEAGATVRLTVSNGTTTVTPTVTLTGTAWTATADLTSVADGAVTVTANSTDAAGNTASDSKTITKNTTTGSASEGAADAAASDAVLASGAWQAEDAAPQMTPAAKLSSKAYATALDQWLADEALSA